MRQWIAVLSIIMLAACAGPEGPEADHAREVEKQKPFSENMKQDGDELSDQIDKDAGEFGKQAKQDAKDVAHNTHETMGGIANGVRDDFKRTGRYLRKWLITPLPEEKHRAVASSYCYNVLQDILCYRQPMPGWEHRLAGYQGTHAEAPPPAMMITLPTKAVDEKQLPENRVANAKAVFKEIPEDTKAQEKEATAAAPGEAPPAEAAHETLPDPALAPQL